MLGPPARARVHTDTRTHTRTCSRRRGVVCTRTQPRSYTGDDDGYKDDDDDDDAPPKPAAALAAAAAAAKAKEAAAANGTAALRAPRRLGTGLVVRGTHYVQLEAPVSGGAMAALRRLQERAFYGATLLYAGLGSGVTPGAWAAGRALSGRLLGAGALLPRNVGVVTLAAWAPRVLLLRLGHMFGVDEDALLSQPATVTIGGLFDGSPFNARGAPRMRCCCCCCC